MRKNRKTAAVAAAILAAALLLTGCQEAPSSLPPEESAASLGNSGETLTLTLAERKVSDERTAMLREIADKYEADFPETTVEIVSCETQEEVEQLLKEGKAQLAEVSDSEAFSYIRQGLLLNLDSYYQAWGERGTLNNAAQAAIATFGKDQVYVIPSGFYQDILYYRTDLVKPEKEDGPVKVRLWEEVIETGKALTDKEKGLYALAIAGGSDLYRFGDQLCWSNYGTGLLADSGAGYYVNGPVAQTIFTMPGFEDALAFFKELMETCVPEEALGWNQEQAVEAFVQGKTAMLIADQRAMETLETELEDGEWAAAAIPRGHAGMAVTTSGYAGWAVSADCEDAGTAAHFLLFLSNSDNNTHFAKNTSLVPIHMDAADKEPAFSEGEFAIFTQMAKHSDWYAYASAPRMYEAFSDYRIEADAKYRAYLEGSLSQNGLITWLDDAWMKAYEEEGKLW